MWVLRASRDKTVVAQGRVRSTAITPVWHDGVLYLPDPAELVGDPLGTESP